MPATTIRWRATFVLKLVASYFVLKKSLGEFDRILWF
jgi:hypothetical protein